MSRPAVTGLEGEWCYPEWDVELQDNKPNFTKVMELSPMSSGSIFVRDVQQQYYGCYEFGVYRVTVRVSHRRQPTKTKLV